MAEPDETTLAGAPGHRWQIGRYTFERWPRAESGPGSRGRWGVSDGSAGVSGHRTPLGAWIAFRRWAREAATLPPAPGGDGVA